MSQQDKKPNIFDNLPSDWEQAILVASERIRDDVDESILFEIIEEAKRKNLQELMETDDGLRPLTDEEVDFRMHRVNGEVICKECGKAYYKHPNETRVVGYDGHPFLKRLCNGWLGKL